MELHGVNAHSPQFLNLPLQFLSTLIGDQMAL